MWFYSKIEVDDIYGMIYMKAAKFNLLVVVAIYFCFGNGVETLVSYANRARNGDAYIYVM